MPLGLRIREYGSLPGLLIIASAPRNYSTFHPETRLLHSEPNRDGIYASRGKEPCGNGAFGWVYQFTIESSEGPKEVAVKIFNMAPHIGRAQEKINHGIRREIHTWLKLRDSTNIVPLFGFANFPEHALPALVSEWMPSGTLYDYLEKPAEIIAKVNLTKGVADGLKYLHSNNVVHGDLHPTGSGNARLTDFGLATVVGDEDWQWNSTTAGRNFNPQWRAPEVIGVGQAGSISHTTEFQE
ncbi:kinase-like domain-containing protein [Suillus lakei]|nr:kinase-like domain-containing protein [Suillus lakei]